MKNKFRRGLLTAALLAIGAGVHAEDIDLFVGVESTQSTDYPNVIILIDNTANWAASNQHWPDSIVQGKAELNAIKAVINSLALDGENAKVNVGLMMLGSDGGNSSDGAYVRSAVKQMTNDERKKFISLIDGINPTNSDEKVASSVGYDRAMFEVFKYFGGHTSPANAYKDTAGSPVDRTHFGPFRYAGADAFNKPENNKRDPAAFDTAVANQAKYIPAAPATETCKSRNYVILIGNGWPSPTEKDSEALLRNVAGNASQIYVSAQPSDVRYADEMARFLYQTDVSAASGKQNVITYTIDVFNSSVTNSNSERPAQAKLLQSMAHVGGGKYFTATNPDEITAALSDIFSEIQAVNSVFASVSLPVSVNTQGTYLNQVYVGMFRPDQNALPRWAGNLKQYKLGQRLADDELQLVDANGKSAINSSTGFIAECARSFWGPSSVSLSHYWDKVARAVGGGCLTVTDSTYDDYPDGNVVEKGAQSYKLRTMSSATVRNLKACPASGCPAPTTSNTTALADFNNTTVSSPSAFGDTVTTTAERDALIAWGRGGDAGASSEFLNGTANTTSTTVRPSVHGDIVHSRPVAINFGTDTDREVVVFYGGNDGLLRAVNGNRDSNDEYSPGSDIGGGAPGGELWSFMAPEFYTKIKRLRDNSIKIKFKGRTVLAGETVAPKPYGVDGPITAYQEDSATWLYATLRRGGRALYAFDVTTPQTPALKWRIGCDDSGCTSRYGRLGQTWSSAKPFKTAGYDSGTTPLLIMGGGYDTCEDRYDDTHNHSCDDTPLGNRIYVINADTGERVAKFDTIRSVVGDVTVVPDSSGLATYAYAADTGGNVYRIKFGSSGAGSWSITKIASLGCGSTGGTSCNANRKFMFAPDVAVSGSTHYVLLGSGDREKPLTSYTAATSVSNYFFMLKDKPTDATWLTEENTKNVCSGDYLCRDSLYPIMTADTPTDTDLAQKKGWYLAFADDEQTVTSAIMVYGVVTFSTHTPAVYTRGQCSSLGTAKVYNINYSNAESENGTTMRYEVISGGGLPPSPVAGMVTLDDGTTHGFIIGADPDSPLQGSSPKGGGGVVQPKAKVYWNIEQ
ncbi:pilus assembly protein [Azotobacter chroococcum]|uniref:Type 4 fimbrial biogenesis PilY1-related protein signal peptide n=1 Tax=Azotobacter chroococcum NCIMB 8003 TaxID=1328314 RepID=A0A0C4WMH8_9GAMM|nr:PilC/PilY family type IV pilus protein [Azotobacter chroococcum]AJE20460.1 Type 4 fimbrial biogenesis PilY1-related protein signal peptide [Azotobacter chroococcum NCIMB 8003]